MRRTARLGIVLLGVLAACASGEPEAPPPAAPIEVTVGPVRRGPIADAVDAVGETVAQHVVRLASPVAGRVTKLTVLRGDRLAQGEVAARVIPAENEAALHGFALLEGAEGSSAEDGERPGGLQRRLRQLDIPLRAPYAAVVADVLHNQGEQVAANDVLLELFDPSSLYVVAEVPLDQADRVRPGMAVELNVAGAPAHGRVSALLSAVTPQVLTVPVRVTLDEPLAAPLLHAPVQCRITVAEHSETLLIPRASLLGSNVAERGAVMVAEEGHARQRAVELGLRTDDVVEVTKGLAEGDLVLTAGHYALPDGTAVHWTAPE
jgi:membrane fusion protein, multidrug efflux system